MLVRTLAPFVDSQPILFGRQNFWLSSPKRTLHCFKVLPNAQDLLSNTFVFSLERFKLPNCAFIRLCCYPLYTLHKGAMPSLDAQKLTSYRAQVLSKLRTCY